ncbi:hypothetical protein HQQ82_11880 [Rathayibacter sp. VKM Ac-2856]|uniref:DUF7010 family protein n=1 Tax=unclassified Rathayibacter TaxID=2609250 RepID=UPI0015631D43|nr:MULTISPECIES: hypothetical protein [unclassified Rathayibacter]NQX05452.1 hypothetical protein [Rathayibacter sp. VKM Ac-2858]NQX20673.1 hypothetical protein [Rathayibacter sp. VKM Ac-2856]
MATEQDGPPRFADPRRLGAVVGLAGAVVFAFSYSPAEPVALVARILVAATVAAALWFLFVRPRPLGPFAPPRPMRLAVYGACVVAEFALIAAGSRALEAAGRGELRPALIALVVGLHFLPFAWAFSERMFAVLGGALVVLGGLGLLVGSGAAAVLAAVASGVVMALLLLAYALGAFAVKGRPREDRPSGLPGG